MTLVKNQKFTIELKKQKNIYKSMEQQTAEKRVASYGAVVRREKEHSTPLINIL